MYQIGDKVVHPMHGAGVIDSIVRKKVAGTVQDYYLLKLSAMTQNWNRRYRENMLRIKSGDLLEVAKVVKSLMLRETQKGLSTGERKMLHSAKQILISELVLAQSMPYEAVEERVNKLLHQ